MITLSGVTAVNINNLTTIRRKRGEDYQGIINEWFHCIRNQKKRYRFVNLDGLLVTTHFKSIYSDVEVTNKMEMYISAVKKKSSVENSPEVIIMSNYCPVFIISLRFHILPPYCIKLQRK